MEAKILLRSKAKEIRKNLPIGKISSELVEIIREDEFYRYSKNVMLYYPMQYEVNLLELLNDDKTFYLPRVDGENIEVCPYKQGDELRKSDFGVLEPICNPIGTKNLDLVIVPALMADEHGFRLGYGGGFYDRFLSANSGVFKSIILLPCQLYVKQLPIEVFDVKVDKVLINQKRNFL